VDRVFKSQTYQECKEMGLFTCILTLKVWAAMHRPAYLWSKAVQFFASGKAVPYTSKIFSPRIVRHISVLVVSQGEKGTCVTHTISQHLHTELRQIAPVQAPTCQVHTFAHTKKSLHRVPRGPLDTTFSMEPAPSFTDRAASDISPTGCENLWNKDDKHLCREQPARCHLCHTDCQH
jgi:hypothetical protein